MIQKESDNRLVGQSIRQQRMCTMESGADIRAAGRILLLHVRKHVTW
jgi:hypothetical protein